jgi:hypothetical protein
MVHAEALPSQPDMQAPIAEAPALMGQCPQPQPQSRVVPPAGMISHRHPQQPIILHARRSLMSNAERR